MSNAHKAEQEQKLSMLRGASVPVEKKFGSPDGKERGLSMQPNDVNIKINFVFFY